MLISVDELQNILQSNNIQITGVLHVGAHDCEELPIYKELGIGDNSIIWIDALDYKVQEAKGHGISNIYTATISDKDNEEIDFNIANSIASSSILQFGTHTYEHPGIVFTNTIKTKTITIDSFIENNGIDSFKYNLLNVDIQGAELLALRGATRYIKNASVLYLEVNERELYKNCALIKDIDLFVSQFNFKRVLTRMTQHGWGDAVYIIHDGPKEFIVNMDAGLGNKLFKLAGGITVSSQTNRKMVLRNPQQGDSPHSNVQYFDTIFRNFKFDTPSYTEYISFDNVDSYNFYNWNMVLKNPELHPITINNFFQHWQYIHANFCEQLYFDKTILNKYPDIHTKTFIHIRGGDYLYIHTLPNLTNYYKKAILEFSENEEFVIFTNDRAYVSRLDWIPTNSIIIDESELDTLFLMSQCKAGITANSTFSWWGAYLNPHRKLILPSHYFNIHQPAISFHFPSSIVINV